MRRKICVVTLFLVFIGQIVMAGGNTADFKYGKWHLKYTLSTGSAEYIYQGKTVFDKVGTGVSGTYTEYEIGQEEITDGFGTEMCFRSEERRNVFYCDEIGRKFTFCHTAFFLI